MAIPKVCIDGKLPSGFALIPLSRAKEEGLLNIHLVAGTTPDLRLINLRSSQQADVFLGCLADSRKRVIEWLDVWVQNPLNGQVYCDTSATTWNNSSADEQWDELVSQLRETQGADFFDLVSTEEPTAPVAINRKNFEAVSLKTSSAKSSWCLCRDEALLQRAGLPSYASSHYRYLHQLGAESGAPLVPLMTDCPTNGSTLPLHDVLGESGDLLVFNPLAGRLAVIRHAPFTLQQFQGVLSGQAWEGIPVAETRLFTNERLLRLSDADERSLTNEFLFGGSRGIHTRIAEMLHLKTNLILQAIGQVHLALGKSQTPLLNLTPSSFRVSVAPVGSGLPMFWTARCQLVQPGAAAIVSCPGSQARYFVPLGKSRGIFQMPLESRHWEGGCEFALVKAPTIEREGAVIQGTVTLQDDIPVSPNDLMWLRIPLENEKLMVYGHATCEKRITGGKFPFSSYPMQLTAAQAASLKNVSFRFPATELRIIPQRTSPCDLYSLAVLAVSLFLDDRRNNLRESLDWILKLSRDVTNQFESNVSLLAHIGKAFRRDARWAEAIGPQHISAGEMTAAHAASAIPDLIWFRLLSCIISMFPGMGPYSHCTDDGDVPPLALEKALEPALMEFRELNHLTRQLIVNNEQMNREILTVIKKLK